MKKKTPVIYATIQGRLYVKVAAIMHPLIAGCDRNLRMIHFGDYVPYLLVDDAINWCREESKFHSKKKYELMISNLEKAKLKHL